MKDIGSIFPLSAKEMSLIDIKVSTSEKNGNKINFSLCREAIYAIVRKYEHTEKIAMIPAYTCQTVIDPFIQQGWRCFYYDIGINLKINTNDLLQKCILFHPTIVVVHPYNGMELNELELETLKIIKQKGIILIEDITQCIYTDSRPDFFDYFTGSYRKWYKVPDGGFVESQHLDGIPIPQEENERFVSIQTESMYLRAKYFETEDETIKSHSVRLNKEAVAKINKDIKCHKMSNFSLAIMEKENHKEFINKRFQNYKFLYNNIHQSKNIKFVCNDINDVTTAPLYFPLYVSDRNEIQKKLAQEHIYAPILWPISTKDLLINEKIIYIYMHILMIPIDQRYNTTDMYRVVKLLNAYL